MSYRVAIEDGFWAFRWRWQARRHFRRFPLKVGESIVLFKDCRNGVVRCLDERYRKL